VYRYHLGEGKGKPDKGREADSLVRGERQLMGRGGKVCAKAPLIEVPRGKRKTREEKKEGNYSACIFRTLRID